MQKGLILLRSAALFRIHLKNDNNEYEDEYEVRQCSFASYSSSSSSSYWLSTAQYFIMGLFIMLT